MTDFFIERMKCDGYSKKYLKYYVLSAFSPLPESKCQMNGEMVKWGEYEVSCLLDICKMLCDLGVTDCKSGLCKSLELYCEIVNNGGCLSVSGLHIKGDDLIKAGFKKSPEIGKILSLLVDGVVEGSVENTPQALLEAAKRYL